MSQKSSRQYIDHKSSQVEVTQTLSHYQSQLLAKVQHIHLRNLSDLTRTISFIRQQEESFERLRKEKLVKQNLKMETMLKELELHRRSKKEQIEFRNQEAMRRARENCRIISRQQEEKRQKTIQELNRFNTMPLSRKLTVQEVVKVKPIIRKRLSQSVLEHFKSTCDLCPKPNHHLAFLEKRSVEETVKRAQQASEQLTLSRQKMHLDIAVTKIKKIEQAKRNKEKILFENVEKNKQKEDYRRKLRQKYLQMQSLAHSRLENSRQSHSLCFDSLRKEKWVNEKVLQVRMKRNQSFLRQCRNWKLVCEQSQTRLTRLSQKDKQNSQRLAEAHAKFEKVRHQNAQKLHKISIQG